MKKFYFLSLVSAFAVGFSLYANAAAQSCEGRLRIVSNTNPNIANLTHYMKVQLENPGKSVVILSLATGVKCFYEPCPSEIPVYMPLTQVSSQNGMTTLQAVYGNQSLRVVYPSKSSPCSTGKVFLTDGSLRTEMAVLP